MFSMAGVPPTVGFYAKFAVLKCRGRYRHDSGWPPSPWRFPSSGRFYYLRVIKLMYFDAPEDTTPLTCPTDLRVTLSANALAVLLLGIFPGGLMALCASAIA